MKGKEQRWTSVVVVVDESTQPPLLDAQNSPAHALPDSVAEAVVLPDDVRCDVLISYATDDLVRCRGVAQTLRTHPDRLVVRFDEPRDNSPAPLVRSLCELSALFRRRRDSSAEPARLTDEQVQGKLQQWLANSDCVLMVWSRSHRGSRWAGVEIDGFQTRYPGKPIFYYILDQAPFSRPSTQFVALPVLSLLDKSYIAQHSGRTPKPHQRDNLRSPLDVLTRPWAVWEAARMLRAGTTLPELVALRSQCPQHEPTKVRRDGLLRNVARAVATGYGFLLLCAALGLWATEGADQNVRAMALALSLVATGFPLLSLSTSAITLLPAMIWTTLIVVVVEVARLRYFVEVKASGAAAGASFAAWVGWVCAVETLHDGKTARSMPAQGWLGCALITGTVVILSNTKALASTYVVGPVLLAALAFFALLLATTLWRELGALARERDALKRGVWSAFLLVVSVSTLGAALAAAFKYLNVHVDSGQYPQGIAAGILSAVCLSAAWGIPHALLPSFSPASLRAYASLVSTTLALLALRLSFPSGTDSHFDEDIAYAVWLYFPVLGATWIVARAWAALVARA